MLPLLALTLACSTSPQTLSDCPDADCRQAHVLAAWDRDPDDAAALVPQLEPLERVAAVNALMERDAPRASRLCGLLEGADARDRCAARSQRGHLFGAPKPAATPHWTAGHSGGVTAAPRVDAVHADVPGASPEDCLVAPTRAHCVGTWAAEAADAGQDRAVVVACRSLDTPRERDECVFLSAERRLRGAAEHYPAASELCLVAGDFAGQCLGHLARALAAAAPAASVGDAASWAPVLDAAAAVRSRWSEADPDYAVVAEHALWSEALLASYGRVDRLSGDPLDAVPPMAVPHVRAAAAALLLRGQRPDAPQHHSLADLVDALARGLDHRAPDHQRARRAAMPTGALPMWQTDRPEDAGFAAIPYLATSRRTVSPDEQADLTICVLEAVARAPQDWSEVLAEGAAHPDPAVAWTARRLQAAERPTRGGAPPPPEALVERTRPR